MNWARGYGMLPEKSYSHKPCTREPVHASFSLQDVPGSSGVMMGGTLQMEVRMALHKWRETDAQMSQNTRSQPSTGSAATCRGSAEPLVTFSTWPLR